MADDKSGREDQAQREDRRQRERAIAEEMERYDEPEPSVARADLEALEADLETVEFPATAADVVAAVGDRALDADGETYSVADLLPHAEAETFEHPDAVRARVERPTVASAMKRVVEASDPLQDEDLGRSQRDAYERTFRALAAIDAVDQDEGIGVIADWIVDQIETKGRLPGSRDVRREAASVCREHGYAVRSDEWLGV